MGNSKGCVLFPFCSDAPGIVVFVGEGTEIGKIAARLASGGTSKKTELTITMERLMYFLVLVGLVFGELLCTAVACIAIMFCNLYLM